jgi:hypothetical protein
MPGDLDSDTAATLALLVVAQAAAALEGITRDLIEIVGSGLMARQVRKLVAVRSAAERTQPIEGLGAIVDTTGDPRVIVDATQRIVNLGTVVLAGESLGHTVEMNLYPDVHVSCLTLVGVPPPLQNAGPLFASTSVEVESSRDLLVPVSPGTPFPPDAVWYRISGLSRPGYSQPVA